MTAGRLIAMGAIAGLLFALGVAMLFSGIARANRRRRETKQVVVTSRTEAEELRMENERLAQALEHHEGRLAADDAGVVTEGAATGASVEQTSVDLPVSSTAEHSIVELPADERDQVDPGAFGADGDAVRRDRYVPRHGDDTYDTPIAYPTEPARAAEDADSPTISRHDLR